MPSPPIVESIALGKSDNRARSATSSSEHEAFLPLAYGFSYSRMDDGKQSHCSAEASQRRDGDHRRRTSSCPNWNPHEGCASRTAGWPPVIVGVFHWDWSTRDSTSGAGGIDWLPEPVGVAEGGKRREWG
jgi:hypothetical protein